MEIIVFFAIFGDQVETKLWNVREVLAFNQ